MAYPRKYARKGKRYGRKTTRRSWYNKKYSVGQLARSAWRGVNYIKGLVNAELYKFDNAIAAGSVASDVPIVQALHNIANGDGDGKRTGNSIFVRNVLIDGVASFNTASTPISQTISMAVVMDKQQIGDTAPGWTDVFDASATFAHLNPSTVGRFTILRRLNLVLDKNGNSTKFFKINIPMRHHVRYNGELAADVQRGGLYFMAISDTAASGDEPLISCRLRTSYHDN